MKYFYSAFAISETFAILLAGFFAKKEKTFLIVLPKTVNLSKEAVQLINSYNGHIEYLSQLIDKNEYFQIERCYIHSFGEIDETKSFLERFKCPFSYYADGLKNEFNFSFHGTSFQSILYFGYIWQKDTQAITNIEVISLTNIHQTWNDFRKFFSVNLHIADNYFNFSWIFLRYWGYEIYKFKENISFENVLSKYILAAEDDKILIKGDSRVPDTSYNSIKKFFNSRSIEAKILTNIIETNNEVNYSLDSLPAELFFDKPISNNIYAFDSAIVIYLSTLGCKRIIFPSEKLAKEIFEFEDAIINVLGYSAMYELVCQQIISTGDRWTKETLLIKTIDEKNFDAEWISSF